MSSSEPLISVVHGPNLNLLGTREPTIYGTESLEDINNTLRQEATILGFDIEFFQSNHEGNLVDQLQSCRNRVQGIVINPAAYTHTSVAIRDAILTLDQAIPIIEVHLSVPGSRESFRKVNMVEDVVSGRIEGFGSMSYLLALKALSKLVAMRG